MGAGTWNTEYDSQCLLSMALRDPDYVDQEAMMGPVAGVCTDQFTRVSDRYSLLRAFVPLSPLLILSCIRTRSLP